MLARWPRPPAVRFCAARRSTCRPICTQADGTTWISASGRAHWGKGQEMRRMGESMKRAALFILAIAAVAAPAGAQERLRVDLTGGLAAPMTLYRTSGVEGKCVYVRVVLGGGRIIKK